MLSKPVWFHEDDFQRVQFLPFSCWDFCLYHLHQISLHSEAHRAPDGIGWTKMYEIPSAPESVGDLSIPVSDLAAAMPWRMRKTMDVYTGGWSGEGSRQPDMAAYRSGRSAIVFGWDERRVIDSLWFKEGAIFWWNRGLLLEAMVRIGLLSHMLLVDWRGEIVDLRDRKATRKYLNMF